MIGPNVTLYAFISFPNQPSIMLQQGNNQAVVGQLSNAVQGSSTTSISITRLDDLFVGTHIHLLKMDCQGCELKTIKGAKALLEGKFIQSIAFEFASAWLRANGDDPLELLLLLRQYGFVLWDTKGVAHSTEEDMRSLSGKYPPGSTTFEDFMCVPSGVHPPQYQGPRDSMGRIPL